MENELAQYGQLLDEVKSRIRQAQTKAVLSVNAEMILLYWDIGKIIHQRQEQEGWGAGVIPCLSRDIKNELPKVKGFSERNIGRMVRFYREYPTLLAILPPPVTKNITMDPAEKVPLPVAKLDHESDLKRILGLVLLVPWTHNVVLFEKINDKAIRTWYLEQVITNGWSRDTLRSMIGSKTHKRHGNTVGNFELRLPRPQSDMVRQTLKDPYIFDFLTISEPFQERELEANLVQHLEKFLLELGQGFAYVGRQYHLDISEKDFYIDLLFYHLKLRCFIVVDLKRGEFKPEYAGKMNFYCSAVDEMLKHDDDQPTIGLILCQTKDRLIAEYTLRDMNKPIGVSGYEFTRVLPDRFRSSLPSIEEIEMELEKRNKDVVLDGNVHARRGSDDEL